MILVLVVQIRNINTVMEKSKPIQVVAGIIYDTSMSQVFITKRNSDKECASLWEFPGGKVEEGEAFEAALKRELMEEIGIKVIDYQPFLSVCDQKKMPILQLSFYQVFTYVGTPQCKERQQGMAWVAIKDLIKFTFPPLNQQVIYKLSSLPSSPFA